MSPVLKRLSWFADMVVMSWCELARAGKRLAPEIRRALYVDVLAKEHAANDEKERLMWSLVSICDMMGA